MKPCTCFLGACHRDRLGPGWYCQLDGAAPLPRSRSGEWVDCPERPPAPGWWWWRWRYLGGGLATAPWAIRISSEGRVVTAEGDGLGRATESISWAGWTFASGDRRRQIWPIPITTTGEPEQASAEPHEAPPRSLEQELRAWSADIERRLDDHVDRFDRVEDRLAVVEARGRRMGEIESLLEALEHRVDDVERSARATEGPYGAEVSAPAFEALPRSVEQKLRAWAAEAQRREGTEATPARGYLEAIEQVLEILDGADDSLAPAALPKPEPKSWAAQEEKEASA